jgi:small subunit ribosomal protein S21
MNKKQKQHQTTVPGNALAVNVINNDLAFALRTWKRKVKSSEVLESIKDRKEFIKPSVKRRQQRQSAQFIQKIKDLNNF